MELKVIVLEQPFRLTCADGKPIDAEVYKDLDLPFELQLHLRMFPALAHPKEPWIRGLLDLVSPIFQICLLYCAK